MQRRAGAGICFEQLTSWKDVEVAINQIITGMDCSSGHNTLASAKELAEVCHQSSFTVPVNVGRGYWNTICFSWNTCEVEVFDDHLETYRFYAAHTEIAEEKPPWRSFQA